MVLLVLQVLGAEACNPAVDPSSIPLEPPRQSPLSQRLCRLLAHLRSAHSGNFALAYAVRQGTPLEAHVLPLFVEDRAQGQFGYSDFLLQLHRGVMNK
jgi:protein transport protein SEC24